MQTRRNHPRPHRRPPGRHAGVSLVRCASNPVCIPRTSGWPAVSRVAYFQTKMPSRLPETNVAMAKQATRHPRDATGSTDVWLYLCMYDGLCLKRKTSCYARRRRNKSLPFVPGALRNLHPFVTTIYALATTSSNVKQQLSQSLIFDIKYSVN